MRHGRAKAARRTLKFFHLNAGIAPPYKVLLDGNFLAAAVRNKMALQDRIRRVLQNENFTLFVTRAALDELQQLPGEVFRQARQLGLDECEIIEQRSIPPTPSVIDGNDADNGGANDNSGGSGSVDTKDVCSASDAVLRLIAPGVGGSAHNPRRYFVATQDADLADEIRGRTPNVPLLKISQSVLLLEAPSTASKRHATREERHKISASGIMTQEEREMVQTVKQQIRAKRASESKQLKANVAVVRRKQKATGPNPLSCKKKRKKDDSVGSLHGGSSNPKKGDTRKKRKRSRK